MDYTPEKVPRYTVAALAEACRALVRDPALMAEYEAWKEARDAGRPDRIDSQPER